MPKQRDEREPKRSRREAPAESAPAQNKALTPEIEAQIVAWTQEAAQANNLSVYDVICLNQGRWSVRLLIDPAGPFVEGASATVADLARVHRYVEALMDADERVPERYALEVSTPGIERVLRTPAHYAWLRGASVCVVTRESIAGQTRFDGALGEFDAVTQTVTMTAQQHPEPVNIPLAVIKRAHVTFDFDQ